MNLLKKRNTNYILFSIVISVLLFHLLFNIRNVYPTNIFWQLHNDNAVGLSSLNLYMQDEWRTPFGAIQNYGYPLGNEIGSNVCTTYVFHPLPLILKLFRDYLPDTGIQIVGIFILLSIFLMSFFSIKLLSLYTKNYILLFLSATFFVFAPALIIRLYDVSLTPHFVILAHFYYLLVPVNKNKINNFLLKVLIIFFLSEFYMIYFLVFSEVFLILTLIKLIWINKYITKLKGIIIYVSVNLIILLKWKILGYFDGPKGAAWGYTHFSANLNTFFNSVNRSVFLKGLTNHTHRQNFEGFGYLGIGIIILLIVVILAFIYLKIIKENNSLLSYFIKKYKKNKINFISHFLLFFACFLLFIYSLSTKATFNGKILYEIKVSEKIFDMLSLFRSSGRFLLALYYFIFFITIKYIVNNSIFNNLKVKIIFLTLILFLQLFDIRNMYLNANETTKNVFKLEFHGFNVAKWEELYSQPKKVLTYPFFEKEIRYRGFQDFGFFCYLSFKYKKPCSAFSSGRFNIEKIREYQGKMRQDVTEGKIEDAYYVVGKEAKEDGNISENIFLQEFKIGYQKGLYEATELDGYYIFSFKNK